MPTNLTVEAKKKWDQVATAKDPREKLRLLQEFLSLVPKHKGTEKLCAQVKTKIATLRREIEDKKRKVGARGSKYYIEKEGAAQVLILGQTNVGRSSLLAAITHAKVEASDYPFTTREPVPGMLSFEDLQFQIVEAPAVVPGAQGRGWSQHTMALARNADGLVLMVDLTRNPAAQLAFLLKELENSRILVRRPKGRVDIERKHMGIGLKVFVIGNLVDCTPKEVEELLKSYRVSNAIVKIYGNVSLDDVEDSIFESAIFRPTVVLANKLDVEGAGRGLRQLEKSIGERLSLIPISCRTGIGLDRLGTELFRSLEIIRIYTKEPSAKEASPTPFILKRNSVVADLAKQIHSDFYRSFDYARVWSQRLRFSPRKVGLSFTLGDKDIVEMHAK
jgi:ribosome-interacting GTPase 1